MLSARCSINIGAACCARSAKRRRCLSTASASDTAPAQGPYRILFFGADTFSCVTLDTLYRERKDLIQHLVVVTPPDQRTGRRLKEIHRPPLRLLAETLELPSIALPPTLLRDWSPPPEFLASDSGAAPLASSLLITASFGHLLPTSLLARFHSLNTLNLHPSLLPKYRGAAPIQWGIINGDADLEGGMGVTIQELSRGKFDRGRILGQERVNIPRNSDFVTLEPILARAGGQLLSNILLDLPKYQLNAKPQDENLASSAPKLTKETSRIDWSTMSAIDLTRRQRGVGHQYPLWTTIKAPATTLSSPQQLQLVLDPVPDTLLRSSLASNLPNPLVPGSLIHHSKQIFVATKSTNSIQEDKDRIQVVKVEKVKKEGGKWVESKEWWNGIKRSIGTCGSVQLS
ncbi:methionyl-tRNA formyltransferase [Sporobolomyces koalae]|uniref:methionyl-tRNA formyltransferase n=1 Tax=Sporobolomyces koalae TaxID=500713 RepID=UPI003173BBFA